MSAYPHHHHDQVLSEQTLSQLDRVEDFQQIAAMFSKLSDPTRVRLFWLLCHSEECVINLSALMNMSSPALSHHLRILKETNLIVSRREGKEVFYKAADSEAAHFLHHMIEQVMRITCPE
ncbi:MAG: metalloregulator ArsR/SmtB family transcription factor [Lachnospiraceae bacterium]|nr:metalloregulator ArsR/SmtB family transcription factor [Lachnospiraceae bacterium]